MEDVALEPPTRDLPAIDSDDGLTINVEDVGAGPETRAIAKQRERMRGVLSTILAGTFAATILLVLVSVLFLGREWEQIRDAVTYLIPALTGLLGAALGFYFGTTMMSWSPGAN